MTVKVRAMKTTPARPPRPSPPAVRRPSHDGSMMSYMPNRLRAKKTNRPPSTRFVAQCWLTGCTSRSSRTPATVSTTAMVEL